MSALGQKRTFCDAEVMSALPPIADMCSAKRDVRFVPEADSCGAEVLYSITASARASSVGGTVMPSALAVFMLRLRSSLVDCSTGSSPGFSPFKIRST